MARRRKPSVLTPILGLALVGVLIVGTIVAVEGEITLFGRTIQLSEKEVQAAETSEFAVRVPISVRGIPAFTRIQGEHVINLATGQLATITLDSRTIPDSVITEADYFDGKLRGRVLRRDKPAGRAFTESDFLPKGARDGITAGIPPGKRGMVLPAESVQGLMDLRSGDRFDIVATWNGKASSGNAAPKTAITSFAAAQSPTTDEPQRSRVEVVVDNGQVIRPVQIRQKPTTSSGLLNGQRISTTPIQEAKIAVTPEEAIRISAAIQSGAVLRCLMRSGHPDDDGAATTLPEDFLPKAEKDDEPEVGEVMILRGDSPERILTKRNRDPR